MTEKEFHKLIEQQNPEEKEAAWRRLEQRLKDENVEIVPAKRKKSLTAWKVFSVCTSVAACLVIGLGLGLGLGLNRGGEDISDTNPPNQTEPVEPEVPEKPIRYFGVSDCTQVEAEYTLKEYSLNNEAELLYWDYYEKTEDYDKFVYQLKDTGEAICLGEMFVNEDGNYVFVYVTDNRTETDFLIWYDTETGTVSQIGNINIFYQNKMEFTRANFEYKGYRYYLEIQFKDSDYLLQIAEEMLSKVE